MLHGVIYLFFARALEITEVTLHGVRDDPNKFLAEFDNSRTRIHEEL